jgi:hypothetical protein
MSILWLLLFIFIAGAIGGVVNALMTDNAFILPKAEITKGNTKIYRPGVLGNIIISGVAACISWGLYGPFSTIFIIGGQIAEPDTPQPGITLATFVGAILVGIAGARWITTEVDKSLLRATAVNTASSVANSQLATQLAMVNPAEAFRISQDIDKK